MKTLNFVLFGALGLFLSSVAFASTPAKANCGTCPITGKIAYVRGGASGAGNGTRLHPYSSLALAQADRTWQTLVVLPGTPLDGGITLRAGSSIIGVNSRSTIINTEPTSNGGNGIVVRRGDACVQNISLQNTEAAAIRYDKARNLTVKNTEISGYNQGELTLPILGSYQHDPSFQTWEVAGLTAQTHQSGSTNLCGVSIHDNNTGFAVMENLYSGAHRKLFVHQCDFHDLRDVFASAPGLSNYGEGIGTFVTDLGTTYNLIVTNSSFHDFLSSPNPANTFENLGIGFVVANGAIGKAFIDRISVKNTASLITGGLDIATEVTTNPTEVGPGIKAQQNFKIKNSVFNESAAIASGLGQGIEFDISDSINNALIQNNRLVNVDIGINIYDAADDKNNIKIINNNISLINNPPGAGAFLSAFTVVDLIGDQSNMHDNITLNHNNYAGPTPIEILPNANGPNAPWTKLIINAKGNCFNGQNIANTSNVGLFGAPFGVLVPGYGTGSAGNATINAKENNIIGYFSDIQDISSGVNYLVPSNWWGQASGPINDSFTPPTGIVDTSTPLPGPITCPRNTMQ